MEQQEEKDVQQTCQDCGKKLSRTKDQNMSYVILNSEQSLIADSVYGDPFLSGSELRKNEDKEQILYHTLQTGEFLGTSVCFECFERIMNELESSINTAEQVRQDYADNLRSMEGETRASKNTCLPAPWHRIRKR